MSGRVLVNGRMVSLAAAARRLRMHAPGKHSQKSHGGGGGSSEEDLDAGDDDGSGPNPDEGKYGYGRDAKGVSYTERDLDDNGEPKFTPEYREKYGPVMHEYGIGAGNRHTITVTEKGSLQATDDSAGTKGRVVIQEFTAKGARGLSSDMNDVIDDGGAVANKATGVSATANGQVHPEGGYNGLDVTWANGSRSSFDPVEAVELAEGLGLAADDI